MNTTKMTAVNVEETRMIVRGISIGISPLVVMVVEEDVVEVEVVVDLSTVIDTFRFVI